MNDINSPIGNVRTTAITLVLNAPVPIASASVIGGIVNGRHAVEVLNNTGSPIYFGGKGVTTATGIAIATGTSRAFNVNRGSNDGLFMVGAGSVIVAEYFS